MPKKLDHDLRALKDRLLTMGALAERMIHDTIATLVDWHIERFAPVPEAEEQMDAMQREIDEETVRLIGVHTPVAADLRLLLVTTRITAEIERIGDQTMNIGFYAREILKQPPLKPLIDLPRMAELAGKMLGQALDAFAKRSSDTAVAVIEQDDRVDDLNDQIFRELMTYLISDPKTIPQALELVLISRAFERIADHAVAIAEDVVYAVQGRDIRHTRPEDAAEDAPAEDAPQ
jgi:phosphate transport system protein